MNKLIAIFIGLVVLQLVSGEEKIWTGPKVVFDKGYFGCGARAAGKNAVKGQDTPPLTLQIIACSLTNWSDKKVYTVQQGEHTEFDKTFSCEKNHYIDDTFAVFQDKLKYFDQNTIELQDFTFHCNDAAEFSLLGVTSDFKDWEIYQYSFIKGFQVEIKRSVGYFESYKHVDLVVFYKDLTAEQIVAYEKLLKGTDDSTYTETQEEVLDVKPTVIDGECTEGLVLIDGECQRVCGSGQVNDHGECRDSCSVLTEVVLEGRCASRCPEGWSVENRTCVAQCGPGSKKFTYSREQYASLVGARRQHKVYNRLNKQLRRKIRQ
eukprot:TRINITY_DN834_c0_g1_i5.p1 TRINITY_DN834_c0_g1~~TRINITY_DN834_c0_g1_i5.p1  ORF type:complete len:320 (+),score=66.32 TRINITY_DN834_c0_g1_i5:130-1089(+)